MPIVMLALLVRAQTALSSNHPRRSIGSDSPTTAAGERGQATTEYALVLLAAALVALLVIGWATTGGGSARISGLFNRVIDAVVDRI